MMRRTGQVTPPTHRRPLPLNVLIGWPGARRVGDGHVTPYQHCPPLPLNVRIGRPGARRVGDGHVTPYQHCPPLPLNVLPGDEGVTAEVTASLRAARLDRLRDARMLAA